MLILQALVLWLMVSAMVIGGAFVFHRLFPRESPWLGFIVAPLAFVALINFIEHFIALPSLLWLLPLFLGPLFWLVVSPSTAWRPLLLPAGIFLGTFAFTFGIRCLVPNILYSSDGISDLNMINNFCQGQKLPPPDTWMPPFRAEWYYSFQHYAASVVKRLLNVKIGVACNVSHGLLSSFICLAGAAAAHRISGGKLWITLIVPFVIESAATGSAAYLQLTSGFNDSLWLSDDLSGGVMNPPDNNLLWQWLAGSSHHERLELQVPGFWTWRDEYHANASGHFLTLFAVWMIAELFLPRRANWPWALALLIPVLAVMASAWALPITLLLGVGAVVIAWLCGHRPEAARATLLLLGGALVVLWPAFYSASSSPQVPDIMATKPEWRVPFLEFVVQWWPVIALWICGVCSWRQLTPGLRWILVVVPVMLIGIELVTIESRYNMVEKMWGYTYGVALIALFPVVAARAGLACRMVTFVLVLSAALSFTGFLVGTLRWAPVADRFHLEGDHYIVSDDQKGRLFQVMTQTKGAIYLSGKCLWCYNECPALGVFTQNQSYIAWSYFESLTNYREEAENRDKIDNAFYAGTLPNRLQFLQANHIAGVVIWPDDAMADDALAALSKELAPAYDYVDCRGDGARNAGVFRLRP
jgi:hypothetical protein